MRNDNKKGTRFWKEFREDVRRMKSLDVKWVYRDFLEFLIFDRKNFHFRDINI